jgi:LuxR family transcriptional regulator, maltose regulon positive regulatory protein
MAIRRVDTARTRLVPTLQLIDRGDLLAALDRASAKKVTIISAPAGSGKSSLLRSWAGRPGSERILLNLEDANAFVVSLDPERTWFRYHHLFGDLLRLELRRTLPELVPALHRRAAEWLLRHGRVADAIRHTQAAAHLASVLEQAECLTAPLSGQCEDDIALDSDLRALALLNLGTVEAWSLGLPDAERHLREGAELARKIGRPYLEVGCLAQLGFASKIHPITITQARCREAITLAERYGWGSEWVIAPALLTLAAAVTWTGDLDQGERLLQRAAQALQADTGPDIRLLMHIVRGLLQAGRSRPQQALEEFSAAERLRRQLVGSHALGSNVTAWMLATQARLGLTGEARAALAALDDERASSGEIGNAAAAIALAEGDPAAALRALPDVLELLAALPQRETAHAALLADILDVLHGASLAAGDQHPARPAEELSTGELRVLRYLPTNLSRPEIATELSVSLNTVSTQIRSIYAKLRVSDRTAAVQRSRELRLLSAARTP